ncbi:addiction module protein [Roseateles sp.]|uniref:addiction module protein n=1 Tax=Roseateles sp. TaxID=1971397 RepID=UPI00395FFDE8
MQSMTEDLQAQVLGLPAEDRARMLELLIASLEPKTAAQQAWTELALKRREDVRAGRTQLVPGDEALARVRASLG